MNACIILIFWIGAVFSSPPVQDVESTVPSACTPGYGGVNCDEVIDACLVQNPCKNHGICESKNSIFVCICPIYFSGETCQHSEDMCSTSYYKGNGYIELNSTALVKSPRESDIFLAMMFKTTEPNGLLIWYGQNKGEEFIGQDFVALAIVDGFLEFRLHLDGEETVVKNTYERVNDGNHHIVAIIRSKNIATLEVDDYTVHGETKETDKTISYLPGNIFIGGAPNITTFTGNHYTQCFNGCISMIEGINSGTIHIPESAVSGFNVVSCPN